MAGFSEEKRNKLQALADRSFYDVSHPGMKAFLERMEKEKGPTLEEIDGGTAPDSYYNAPRGRDLDEIDVVVAGLPYEVTAPLRAGTRFGPKSMREWSIFRGPVHDVWQTIPFELCSIADYGDIALPSPHSAHDCVETVAALYAQFREHNVAPLTIGGVHTLSHPVLRGLSAGEPVGCVHIDAHGDTAPGVYQGTKYNDCAPFVNAVLDEAIDPERMVQIGIRNGMTPYWNFSEESGMRVIHAHEFFDIGVEGTLAEIKRVVGDGPFYFTLDVDGIDSTDFPGTQLPEPFGLTGRETVQLIRGLRGMDLVGADICELSPPYDPHGISANLGSAIGFELLCLLAESHVARHGQKRQTHWS